VGSLGVLWLEAWVRPTAHPPAGVRIVLFAGYWAGDTVFLWGFEPASSGGLAATLTLVTGGGATTEVKRWGPLPRAAVLEAWHHVALTLRFARLPAAGGSCTGEPAAALAQAHVFLDGEPLDAGDGFLRLDVLGGALTIEHGLSEIYFGGPSPDQVRGGAHAAGGGVFDQWSNSV
jgi:hypothetical protein